MVSKTKIKDWACSVCGKKYKTYLVILDNSEFGIIYELEIRTKYYDYKLKKGLCEECRKEILKNG